MPVKVLMPALSPTMKSGKLAKWCKKEGEMVESGQVLAEIETDKATMEFEVVDEGKLAKILVKEGTENVEVNCPIALILEEGETEEDLKAFESASVDSTGASDTKADSADLAKENQIDSVKKENSSSQEAEIKTVIDDKDQSRIKATPLAKKIAAQNNIDLAGINGSGPGGRIIKDDLSSLINTASEQKKPSALGLLSRGQSDNQDKILQVSSMRRTIASRLVESKQQIPHFYLVAECTLDNLLQLRKQINDSLESKITINDFIVKASGLAIKKVPQMRCSWQDGNIVQFGSIDISVAVSIEDGLITPIVKDVDKKPLSIVSSAVKELVQKAKDGSLAPQEFQGGCFTISNLGMYGIKEFSAIINPPQAAILAVGAAKKTAVVTEGNKIEIKTVMKVTLSCDHRVADGAVAAQFLNKFVNYIENPVVILT